MVELIREVASIIRDLEALRLIEPGVVDTVKRWDEKGECIFRVGFRTTPESIALCDEMFKSVREKGYVARQMILDSKTILYEFRKK